MSSFKLIYMFDISPLRSLRSLQSK